MVMVSQGWESDVERRILKVIGYVENQQYPQQYRMVAPIKVGTALYTQHKVHFPLSYRLLIPTKTDRRLRGKKKDENNYL